MISLSISSTVKTRFSQLWPKISYPLGVLPRVQGPSLYVVRTVCFDLLVTFSMQYVLTNGTPGDALNNGSAMASMGTAGEMIPIRDVVRRVVVRNSSCLRLG